MRRFAIFALALFLALASPVPAEEDMGFIESIVELASEWVDGNVPEDISVMLDVPTRENWDSFWETVEETLANGSPEDLAWILPEVETAVGYLASIPGCEPYAVWLQQRLDYFSVADDALQTVAHIRERDLRPPALRGRVSIVPPPRALTATLPSAEEDQVAALLRDQKMWERKLASRQPPEEASMMIPMLKEIFAGEGIPPEWVWLSEVESSLNPHARSPSGAVGLFQFMPDTARRFGLRTGLVDERTSPQKSARAAARYLKALRQQFGSWPLALAAYNAGEGCISRLLKRHSAKSFEEIAPRLPIQTQMFVPKVLATVSLRESIDPHTLPSSL